MIGLEKVSLHHHRRIVPVFSSLSLAVPRGAWVSVAGPNGSGKSTLLKLMCGLLGASEGRVYIDGIELTPETIDDARTKIGVVFQNPDNQFVGLTVEDDIAFGLENRGIDRDEMRERVRASAARLGIEALLPRHPQELSGGQKQLAALAAVLATEPEAVLFDEATSMLDEAGRRDVLRVMKELHATGRYTIVAVTHDTDEMLASDRVVALADGRIVFDGAPRTMLGDAALVAACRLRAPFARRLADALRARGLDVGDVFDEEELMEALWTYAFDSRT
ncbi:ATP-binding cassette domain-containing protein [Paenibacillus sp. TRM 82003]|nr:ATP-binding cassette domain-containing protein [Paenibacillus sp. TRM 82003]